MSPMQQSAMCIMDRNQLVVLMLKMDQKASKVERNPQNMNQQGNTSDGQGWWVHPVMVMVRRQCGGWKERTNEDKGRLQPAVLR